MARPADGRASSVDTQAPTTWAAAQLDDRRGGVARLGGGVDRRRCRHDRKACGDRDLVGSRARDREGDRIGPRGGVGGHDRLTQGAVGVARAVVVIGGRVHDKCRPGSRRHSRQQHQLARGHQNRESGSCQSRWPTTSTRPSDRRWPGEVSHGISALSEIWIAAIEVGCVPLVERPTSGTPLWSGREVAVGIGDQMRRRLSGEQAHLPAGTHLHDHRVGHRVTRHEVQVRRRRQRLHHTGTP